METATTRMASRSSTRHGPSAVFTGRVRKWRKKWFRAGAGDHLEVLRWVVINSAAPSTTGALEDSNDTLAPQKIQYLPVSVLKSRMKERQTADAAAGESTQKAEAQTYLISQKQAVEAAGEATSDMGAADEMEVETGQGIQQEAAGRGGGEKELLVEDSDMQPPMGDSDVDPVIVRNDHKNKETEADVEAAAVREHSLVVSHAQDDSVGGDANSHGEGHIAQVDDEEEA
eukprot:jgi/Mesen1/2489/ME000159S01613